MAGYTSTPRQYGEYIQPYNIDLIAKALTYKQNKYDAADAQIRQQINQIGSMDLLKSEDKGYLLSRLSSMLGDVNNVGALDLSDSGIVRNLDNHISQSIDDKVLNAYQSTKQIRAFQQSIQELQKKNPELYNVKNVAFAMRPVDAYMRSGKVGESISDYGSLNYTPYVNKQEVVNKRMESYVKNMKDGIIKMPGKKVVDKDGKVISDDSNIIYEIDTNGMTDDQIYQLVSDQVSSEFQEQTRIDAWARYDRYSPQGMAVYKNDVDSYIGNKKGQYDRNIQSLETRLHSITDNGVDTSALKTQINNLKSEREKLDSFGSQMLQNPEAYGGILEKEGLVSNLSRIYKPFLMPKPNSYHGVNEAYYKEKELEYKQLEYNLKVEKHALDVRKDQREAEEFRLKSEGKWNPDGNNKNGSSSKSNPEESSISLGALPTTPEEKDWESEKNKILLEKNTQIKTDTGAAFDYMNRLYRSGGDMSEQARTVLGEYDIQKRSKGIKGEDGGLFRNILLTTGRRLGFKFIEDANGNKLFNLSKLSSDVEEFVDLNKRYKKIDDDTLNNAFNKQINSKEFSKNLATENKIMVATPNGLLNLKELAVQRGVIDNNGNKIKNVSDDAYLKNTIKANVYLGQMQFGKVYSMGIASGVDRKKRHFTDKKIAKDLGDIYKEDIYSLLDDSNNISLEKLKQVAPRTYAAIINYDKNASWTVVTGGNKSHNSDNVFGTNTRVTQDSFFTPLTRDNLLTGKDSGGKTLKEVRNQEIMNTLKGVGVDNGITMSNPKDPVFRTFVDQITGGFARSVDGDLSDDTLKTISPNSIEQLSYRVRSKDDEILVSFKMKGENGFGVLHQAKLSISDLKRNPSTSNFMNQLDFQEQNFYYSQKGMGNKKVATSSDGISFISPTKGFVYSSKLQNNLREEFGHLPFFDAVVTGIHKDDSKRYLKEMFTFNKVNELWYNNIILNKTLTEEEKIKAIQAQQQTYYGAVDKMVDSSSNYILDASFISANDYAIQLKDKQGKTIAGVVEKGDNLKSIKNLFDSYESSAYNMFLASIINEERRNLAYKTSGFTEQFKNLTGLQ